MIYGVLVEHPALHELIDVTKDLSGVNKVLDTVPKALKWIKDNPVSTLIVRMPMSAAERKALAEELSTVSDQVIALDPESLLSEEKPAFTRTITIQLNLVRQIKNIIEQPVYS